MPSTGATRATTASVSAGIAAANERPPKPAEPRFPAEAGGRFIAEMAHIDLDAALQLLAERAQYITGASGAAIALRRGEHNDMLCRASAGSNAPELGALLSMEYGLSGESVRTQRTLLCDDAENDPRVNREGCRQLGIASVVVMPIVSEQQVLGVFELFSGTPRAFEPRDIAALQRLSEMVETAVKHAVAALSVPAVGESVEVHPPVEEVAATPVESPVNVTGATSILTPPMHDIPPKAPQLPEPVEMIVEKADLSEAKLEPVSSPESLAKKPLFWSAALQTPPSAARENETPTSVAVPLGLRNLQKCQACGFPVSQGRQFCVECEEKQWRGQPLSSQSGEPAQAEGAGDDPPKAVPARPAAVTAPLRNPDSAPVESSAITPQPSGTPSPHIRDASADVSVSASSTLFLCSAASSESWLAANKYTLGALLVVALVVAAIVWLR